MATNYDINYNDERFVEVEADKKAALTENEKTYGGMISNSDKYYQAQIDAAKDWEKKQTEIQNQQTDFAIEKIEQQKDQAKKDYTKEQSGAYVDWQKQSNEYGANAEKEAAAGLAYGGYSESAQVSMYNTYQNRVTSARESYNLAVINYNNAIKDARLQNSSALAEIAYNALQQQLELSLQGFQYKNTLLLEQANKKLQIEESYYNRYQDVLAQINQENALAEQIRQYNETLAEQKRQHSEEMAYKNAALAEEKRQFDASLAEQQRQYNASRSSSGGGGGGGTISKNTAKSSKSVGTVKKTGTNKGTKGAKVGSGSSSLTYTDVAYSAAELRKSGASRNEILQYINEKTSSSSYKATTSKDWDRKELVSAYVGAGR